ncbi:MAG: hypothetical protein ABJF27_11795 [Crocinitomicaceae bacterium]
MKAAMESTKKNKIRLLLALALFLVSYFLPVLQYQLDEEMIKVYGWEVALDVIVNPKSYVIYDNAVLLVGQYILMNLATPTILLFLILGFGKIGTARTRWMIGTIAMLSACVYLPFFFTMIFDYFSIGFYAWIFGITLLYYYLNNASFKRPKA